jgi:hypothetical protein
MNDIVRPPSPSVTDKSGGRVWDPSDLNPELAMIAMQREYGKKWPTPTVISKVFAVYHGMWRVLNHVDDTHPTYYDCGMRVALYDNVGCQSVNIEGKLFNNLFTMWNKPKVVMQGVSQIPSGFEEEKPGIIARLWGGLTGKGSQPENKT